MKNATKRLVILSTAAAATAATSACKGEETQNGSNEAVCMIENNMFCMTNEERLKATIEVSLMKGKFRFFRESGETGAESTHPQLGSQEVKNDCTTSIGGRYFGGGYVAFYETPTCKGLIDEESFMASSEGEWSLTTVDESVRLKGTTAQGKVTIDDKTYHCLQMAVAPVHEDGDIVSNMMLDILVLADRPIEKASELSSVEISHILASRGACEALYQ